MVWGRHQVRAAESVDELTRAERLLVAVLGERWAGWREASFFANRFPSEADLMAVAQSSDGDIVGAALAHIADERVVLAALAVAPNRRRGGIGADLLAFLEESARRRGASGITLGSVDQAMGFYLRRGYKPLLLVQFAQQHGVEELIDQARAGPLAGLRCVRREFDGVPQLFVEVNGVDRGLRERVEAELPGVSARFVLAKDFR